ncbi:hypothetical protein EYF80_058040 [Liparis tanakae]|uniref:Uncharacterized protein n=1 Tax=Liparis tanakae TaxID=230148 RepID=A0A4Z2ESP5_9TELE|nr:hypothetical protein EYF80_058040 [Liparis tanakae]
MASLDVGVMKDRRSSSPPRAHTNTRRPVLTVWQMTSSPGTLHITPGTVFIKVTGPRPVNPRSFMLSTHGGVGRPHFPNQKVDVEDGTQRVVGRRIKM